MVRSHSEKSDVLRDEGRKRVAKILKK